MPDDQPPVSPDIRTELQRLTRMPEWGRRQQDQWDKASRFIYRVHSLDALRQETRRVAAARGFPLGEFAAYVVHRWYNFHTHQVVLDILCAHPRVRRETNPHHHSVDFYLDGIPFDLKLTSFPRAYPHLLDEARARPADLVNWLYREQSRGGRYHAANRLFVVFHHALEPERTWEVRRMFDRIERSLAEFLMDPAFVQADVMGPDGTHHRPLAGVIFCIYG
ncbi:MAG: hypothetical protein ACUVSG_02580 [Anaerolineae bacterium]